MAGGIGATSPRPHPNHRIAIVVPYRDRARQKDQFLFHMARFFRGRDDVSIHIIEQDDQATFNRGRLKNAGFALVREALALKTGDAVCFHDIDYLPIQADYSPPPSPARLIWHGLRLSEDPDEFLGAVVLFPLDDFRRVNGYSNDYQGWGYEDWDLYLRCRAEHLPITRREGIFQSLEHPSHGYDDSGELTPEGQATEDLFVARFPLIADGFHHGEGLSSLTYSVSAQERIPGALPETWHWKVRF